MKTGYIDVITSELKEFGCGDVQKAYDMIFGDINVDGLWYRVEKRLSK